MSLERTIKIYTPPLYVLPQWIECSPKAKDIEALEDELDQIILEGYENPPSDYFLNLLDNIPDKNHHNDIIK